MAYSNDGIYHKDKYLDTSRKIFRFIKMVKINVKFKRLSSSRKIFSQGILFRINKALTVEK